MQQQPEAATWDFDPETTLVRLVVANAQAVPDAVAMREKDRGIWQETTWAQMADTVLSVAAGLQQMGLARGKGVLVLGDNRPRLYMGMLCAGVLGAYAMPVYPDAAPQEVLHVASEVEVAFVIAEDQEQVDKALDLRERGAYIGNIVYDNPRGVSRYTAPGLVS